MRSHAAVVRCGAALVLFAPELSTLRTSSAASSASVTFQEPNRRISAGPILSCTSAKKRLLPVSSWNSTVPKDHRSNCGVARHGS